MHKRQPSSNGSFRVSSLNAMKEGCMRTSLNRLLRMFALLAGLFVVGCEPAASPRLPDPSGLRSIQNPFTKDSRVWFTEFHLAVYNADEAALDEMIRHGGHAGFKDSEENEPLDFLMQSKRQPEVRVRILRKLVEHGADVNLPESRSRATALHRAARSGMVEMTRALCELGANPNSRDVNGWTPLHEAARCYQGKEWRELSEILVQNGADPLAKTRSGETILDVIYSSTPLSREARTFFHKLKEDAIKKNADEDKNVR